MSAVHRFLTSGPLPPQVHGILDYPLAAALIAGPLLLDFDSSTATTIALIFGAGAVLLAIGTNWSKGIVRVLPPIWHGVADVTVTIALIAMPFIAGFSDDAVATAFYLVVGIGGLLATLLTRFESDLDESAVTRRPLAT